MLFEYAQKPLMADRAKVNAVPAVESSFLMVASNIEPTLSSSVAGTLCNTNGKPRARRGSATDPQSLYARVYKTLLATIDVRHSECTAIYSCSSLCV